MQTANLYDSATFEREIPQILLLHANEINGRLLGPMLELLAARGYRFVPLDEVLADPAYLDPSIDPDDRPLGSLFAFPDPLDANYGRGGLARTMTARGWLSTWSGLSSNASMVKTAPAVSQPTLMIHYSGDATVFPADAALIIESIGAEQKESHVFPGDHHGHAIGHGPAGRGPAGETIAAWLRQHFPTGE